MKDPVFRIAEALELQNDLFRQWKESILLSLKKFRAAQIPKWKARQRQSFNRAKINCFLMSR